MATWTPAATETAAPARRPRRRIFGRIVLEKGIDQFAETIAMLRGRGHRLRSGLRLPSAHPPVMPQAGRYRAARDRPDHRQADPDRHVHHVVQEHLHPDEHQQERDALAVDALDEREQLLHHLGEAISRRWLCDHLKGQDVHLGGLEGLHMLCGQRPLGFCIGCWNLDLLYVGGTGRQDIKLPFMLLFSVTFEREEGFIFSYGSSCLIF